MAETIISPGVFTRENDISFIQPAAAAVGAAIIGPTVKGPVEIPTLVTSYNDFSRKFGVTFESGSTKQEFLTSIAVKSYFDQGGESVLVSRVVSGSFTSAESTYIDTLGSDTGGTLFTTKDALLGSFDGGYNITGSTAGAVNDVKSSDQNVTASFTLASDNSITSITVTGQVGTFAVGDDITFTSESLGATKPDGTDLVISLVSNDITSTSSTSPFVLKTIGKGAILNNALNVNDQGQHNSDGSLVSGSADNLRYEISNVDTSKGTFTLTIRRGDDNTNSKIILETFNGLSLDPNSTDYIASRIGDQYATTSTGEVIITGDYPNISNYVYVSAVNTPTLNYLGNDGNIRLGSLSGSLPIAQSGSFYNATGNIVSSVDGNNNYFGDIAAGTQGLVADNYTNAITILENKDDYQFNIISAPGLTHEDHGTTVDSIISLAETRGDCIAVIDTNAYDITTIATVTNEAAELNSSYAAAYWPWLQVGSATGKNVWVPASTVIPGVYAFTDNSSAPWFAPAGLVRGGLVGVIQAKKKLSRSDRDSLYSGKVNPIATFPGTGIAVFGQKTLQTKASALDRVNVRRLLIELKRFLGNQARNLVFEQNTIATRNSFLQAVNPYLTSVVQQQGLFAYRVVMDDSNNTADVVDRNQLVGQIFIQPAKTAEFIVLDFVVEPTGATFGA